MTLFSDGFESGNLNEWTGTQVHDTSTATVETNNPHHGTYNLKANISSSTPSYAEVNKTLTSAVSTIYCGAYVKFATALPNATHRYVPIILYSSGFAGYPALVAIRESGGTTYWTLEINNNGTREQTISGVPVSLDTWYWVELYWKKGAADGAATLYINGTAVASVTAKDTDNDGDVAIVGFGDDDSNGPAHQVYIDCVSVSNTYIGPEYLTATAPLQLSGSNLSIPQANGSADGYLSASHWNTFNNKYGSGASPTFAGLTTTGILNSNASGASPVANSNAGMILDCYTPNHRDGLGIQSGGIWLKYDDSFNIYNDNGTTVLEAVHLDNSGNIAIGGAYMSNVSSSAPDPHSNAGLKLDLWPAAHSDGIGMQNGGMWLKYDNQFDIYRDSGSSINNSLHLDSAGNVTLTGGIKANDIIEGEQNFYHIYPESNLGLYQPQQGEISIHDFLFNDHPYNDPIAGEFRLAHLDYGGYDTNIYGALFRFPEVSPAVVNSHHLIVRKDFLVRGVVESYEGVLRLHGGYAGWAPSINPLIYLAEGGYFGNKNTLEIRKVDNVTGSPPTLVWGWGDLACGTITSAGNLYLTGNTNGYLWNNGGFIRQSGSTSYNGLNYTGGFIADGSISVGAVLNAGFGSGMRGPLYAYGSTNSYGGTLAFNSSSQRYKQNIEMLADCSWLYNLRPVSFDWKDTERAKIDGRQIGLIAEEVNALCPQITWHDDTGQPEGVHYEWLGVPLLVEVKKHETRIGQLEEEVASLQQQLEILKNLKGDVNKIE